MSKRPKRPTIVRSGSIASCADRKTHYFIVCETCVQHLKADAVTDKIVRHVCIVHEKDCIVYSMYN